MPCAADIVPLLTDDCNCRWPRMVALKTSMPPPEIAVHLADC